MLTEDTGVPFHQLQAEQIQRFRDAWREAGHDPEPRVSVSRSIFALVNDLDHAYFGMRGDDTDQSGSSTTPPRGSAAATPPNRTS